MLRLDRGIRKIGSDGKEITRSSRVMTEREENVGDNDRERKMPGSNDKNKNLTLRRKKMKLSILLAGSILTSAIAGNAYAQTCGAQPSCSDLGYTYTGSTSDCLSPALKCPFNTSYFNCTKKADTFYQFKLNWAWASDIPGKQDWPAYQNGIVIGHAHDIKNYALLSSSTAKKSVR